MAISLSTIQSRLGGSNPIGFVEYFTGNGYVNDNYDFTNGLNGSPLSGTDNGSVPTAPSSLSMTELDTANKAITWTESSSPLKTPYGSNVYSISYNIAQHLRNPTSGKQFYICASLSNSTSWKQFPHLTSLFTYGTPKTATAWYVASKQFYIQIIYAGGSTVQLRGYYSGDSTNYPNGQVYLSGIGELGN